MVRWFVVVAVCLAVLPLSTVRAAEKRVALVVGVGRYRNAPALPNPPNDARLIAGSLKQLGFDTQTVIDPDNDALKRAVRTFGDRIDGATVALFYYAGHGLQVAGRNYLLPVDATIAKEADLRYEAFDVQAILDQMDGPNRVNLVFLDACRDNPFSRSLAAHLGTRSLAVGRGLARIDTNASGLLIAYATDPEAVAADGDGADSPFTAALARHIMTPGLDVRQMLTRVRVDVRSQTNGQQRPWVSDALDSDFYFVPQRPQASPPVQTALAPPVSIPPAQPPSPPLMPSSPLISPTHFFVFFDYNRTDITPRGLTIVSAAENALRSAPDAKLAVFGFEDSYESSLPNANFSMERAKAVVAELVKDGVPAERILMRDFGSQLPIVPTNPGIREPQNRRVLIELKQ